MLDTSPSLTCCKTFCLHPAVGGSLCSQLCLLHFWALASNLLCSLLLLDQIFRSRWLKPPEPPLQCLSAELLCPLTEMAEQLHKHQAKPKRLYREQIMLCLFSASYPTLLGTQLWVRQAWWDPYSFKKLWFHSRNAQLGGKSRTGRSKDEDFIQLAQGLSPESCAKWYPQFRSKANSSLPNALLKQ